MGGRGSSSASAKATAASNFAASLNAYIAGYQNSSGFKTVKQRDAAFMAITMKEMLEDGTDIKGMADSREFQNIVITLNNPYINSANINALSFISAEYSGNRPSKGKPMGMKDSDWEAAHERLADNIERLMMKHKGYTPEDIAAVVYYDQHLRRYGII